MILGEAEMRAGLFGCSYSNCQWHLSSVDSWCNRRLWRCWFLFNRVELCSSPQTHAVAGRTQERKGENDGGRLLRRRVFGGGVREWEEREARKESVWRGGGGKRVKEREREAPELLLMLLLLPLQPFDNSPPIQSAEEGRRSEQGWRRSKRHLSKDAPVLSRRER